MANLPFYELTTLPGIKTKIPASSLGSGGLAAMYYADDLNQGLIDVAGKYAWTLSPPLPDSCQFESTDNVRTNVPVIELREFEVNESTISRQLQFYFDAAFTSARDYLAPYDDLFPKDRPTNILYKFPYFSDTNFEVSSPPWVPLDGIESFYSGAKNLATKGVEILAGEKWAGRLESFMGLVESGAKAGAALAFPKIGIMDRPRLWSHHELRNITFSFPLFNTYNFENSNNPEWIKNRELCWLFVIQNLFNKRSFITGIPPVFYEVLIPGQHFSIAACVTNLTVYNRGNMRLMLGPEQNSRLSGEVNVPDVYELQVTLTDMVMPSKNQLHAVFDEHVRAACRNP